jgi:hypothetical protein
VSAPASRRLRKADIVAWERLSSADRAWFLANPGRSYRLRPIDEAERLILLAPAATHALVRQVRPGFRLRRPVVIAGTIPDLDPVLAKFDREDRIEVGPGGSA